MSDNTLKVLVVEPQKLSRTVEIPNRLDALQAIVGGHIEAIPLPGPAAIVCNESGKLLGLPYNRPLLGEDGQPYDVICGTFLVAGVGAEDFVSLTENQLRQFRNLYDNILILLPETETPRNNHSEQKKKRGKHHER